MIVSSLPASLLYILVIILLLVATQLVYLIYAFVSIKRFWHVTVVSVMVIIDILLIASVECSYNPSLHKLPIVFDISNLHHHVLYTIVFIIFLVTTYFVMVYLRFSRSSVSNESIKESIDLLPVGIIVYDVDGHVRLINHSMISILTAIQGTIEYNGLTIRDRLHSQSLGGNENDFYIEVDGTMYEITVNKRNVSIGSINELLCHDVTELYRVTAELIRNQDELELENKTIANYGQTMIDFIRKEEMLKAKVDIHRNMNSILMQTTRSIGSIDREREALQKWINLSSLVKQSFVDQTDFLTDVKNIASSINVELIIEGEIELKEEKQKNFVAVALSEAVINAYKYGNAKTVHVSVLEDEFATVLEVSNDGTSPADINPQGGLMNLVELAKTIDAEIDFILDNQYIIRIALRR